MVYVVISEPSIFREKKYYSKNVIVFVLYFRYFQWSAPEVHDELYIQVRMLLNLFKKLYLFQENVHMICLNII